MTNKLQTFGPYKIEVLNTNHCIICRSDGEPTNPTFYELQHMKCLAFGGDQIAVEIFPKMEQLIDGQNYRHLWLVPDKLLVPNLRTGVTTFVNTVLNANQLSRVNEQNANRPTCRWRRAKVFSNTQS